MSDDSRLAAETPAVGGLAGGSKARFVLRRLAFAPAILLGVCFAVFVMIGLSPNDAVRAKAGINISLDPVQYERLAAELGLNDPLLLQFWRFLVDLVHLDLGHSFLRPESVAERIALALPVTIQLVVLSTLVAVILSLVFGTAAAQTDGRLTDRVISMAAAVFQATPAFWAGIIFIQLFAVQFSILPSGGYSSLAGGFTYWFTSMVGPTIVLALPFTAAMTRVVRASMADELAKDYVRTAIGAGVSWPVVLGRNVLRNALVTPITVLGVHVGALMSGAILVELVFDLPGMGTLLVGGVTGSDLPVVRGVAIVGAMAFVAVNLVVDLAYLFLNPRSAEASAR